LEKGVGRGLKKIGPLSENSLPP